MLCNQSSHNLQFCIETPTGFFICSRRMVKCKTWQWLKMMDFHGNHSQHQIFDNNKLVHITLNYLQHQHFHTTKLVYTKFNHNTLVHRTKSLVYFAAILLQHQTCLRQPAGASNPFKTPSSTHQHVNNIESS